MISKSPLYNARLDLQLLLDSCSITHRKKLERVICYYRRTTKILYLRSDEALAVLVRITLFSAFSRVKSSRADPQRIAFNATERDHDNQGD